jgi:leucyl-tRNA synthetase
VFDEQLAADDSVQLAVQVNGKLRGTIRATPAVTQGDALSAALANPAIARFVEGAPKKVVFVPGRLLNIVV